MDECLFMALSRHRKAADQCPLSGVKQTLQFMSVMSASDPKRTSATRPNKNPGVRPGLFMISAAVYGQRVANRTFTPKRTTLKLMLFTKQGPAQTFRLKRSNLSK
jgi:hypothetical protein